MDKIYFYVVLERICLYISHHAIISVHDMPLGRRMWQSGEYGGLTTAPIKVHVSDNFHVKMLKTLIMSMVSFEPSERPTAAQVLQEITNITGTTVLLLLIIEDLSV